MTLVVSLSDYLRAMCDLMTLGSYGQCEPVIQLLIFLFYQSGVFGINFSLILAGKYGATGNDAHRYWSMFFSNIVAANPAISAKDILALSAYDRIM